MVQSICKNCGKNFLAKPSQPQEHCSRACQKETGKKRRQRICEWCSKQFEVNTSAKEGRYCSLECSALAQRSRPARHCEQCGNPFHVKSSSKRKYCSHACFFDASRGQERLVMKGRPTWNKGLTAETNEMIAQAAIKRTGENHHNWKGGHVKYYGPNWKRQSQLARQRDGHRCRHCGITQKKLGRKLDVHHIARFKSFGYVRDQNDNYRQANQLTNLITLCPDCHGRAEWKQIPIQPTLI